MHNVLIIYQYKMYLLYTYAQCINCIAMYSLLIVRVNWIANLFEFAIDVISLHCFYFQRNSKSKTSFGQDRSATKSSLLESYRHPSNKIMNVKLTHSLPDSGDIKSDIVSDGNALMSGRQGSEAAFQSIGSYQLPSDDGWVEFVESAQSGAIKPVKTDILQSWWRNVCNIKHLVKT